MVRRDKEMESMERTYPFCLDKEGEFWVRETMKGMTLKEKVGQLIFAYGYSHERDFIDNLLKDIKPGGIMFRANERETVRSTSEYIQKNSEIPFLISGNLESGGAGIDLSGTHVGNNMLVAATNEPAYSEELGAICAREGSAVGANMSFSPVVDLNINFRNAAVNVRAFSDCEELVGDMGKAFMRGMLSNDMIPTLKHFPGDGIDARDQHVITTANNLDYDEWDETYGSVYRELIAAGACSVMVGHIALPGFYRRFYRDVKDPQMIPATISKEILQDLLRKRLGYRGLIITDSTLMSGINWLGKRSELVPKFIQAGCDMVLFTKDPVEDVDAILRACEEGTLSTERIEESVERVLSLKAKLGLHRRDSRKIKNEADYRQNIEKAREIAHRGITLVRDRDEILPLDPLQKKRILLHNLGNETPKNLGLRDYFIEKMEGEGFEVEVSSYCEETPEDLMKSDDYYTERYDLIVYLANKDVISNQTHLNLEVKSRLGLDAPWLINQISTVFISLSNPYHLYDFPMVKTLINGYFPSRLTIDSIVDKIMGRSEFVGVSPVKLEGLF